MWVVYTLILKNIIIGVLSPIMDKINPGRVNLKL